MSLGGLLLADAVALASNDLTTRIGERFARLSALRIDEVLLTGTAVLGGFWLLTALLDRLGRKRLAAVLAGREEEARASRHLALRDPLTDLLNRRGLEEAFAGSMPPGEGRAVILCDLDGFKHVNDTLGHAAGDAVLRRFAERLSGLHFVGADIRCVRLGGDEFVVLVTARDVVGCAIRMAQSISAISEQADETWPVSVSIGIVPAGPASQLDELLIAADTAMYDAKRSGEAFRVFEADAPGAAREPSRMFERQLKAVEPARQSNLFVAALGVDGYRRVRRAHGNGVCGKLMRELQRRLEQAGTIAVERMAPDTLGVLIEAADVATATALLERLRRELDLSFNLSGLTVDLSLTTGLAGPASVTALRDHAELAQAALDEAWRTGEITVVHDAARQEQLLINRTLMSDLDDALAGDRLEVHYQPKLCSKTNQIDSLEALVRWNHPRLGQIPPGRFVAVAEELGNIRPLTEWVVDRVVADQARLAAEGVDRPIYINISAQLICEAEFTGHLLRRLGTCASTIGIEITETAVLANPERALRHLNELAAAGISIAIDDYGVGLSSLAYLKQLPAKELKIDMLFITDLADSHRDPMIVRSTIDLAHGLGLRVTAEGVDNPLSLGLLRVMGCDLLQGFEISRPLPLSLLIPFLQAREGERASDAIPPFSYGKLAAAA